MGLGQTTCERTYADMGPWAPAATNSYSVAEAAVYLATAYLWLTEAATQDDREKLTGPEFRRFEDHVLGYADGIAKTPGWAARFSGVPSYSIKALAQHWGRQAAPGATGNEEELAALVSQTQGLGPEPAARPEPRCAGAAGSFLGGTVFDYERDEVIESALVTLRPGPPDDAAGIGDGEPAEMSVPTDALGNFFVDGLNEGTYLVSIEKKGYLPRMWGPVRVGGGGSLRDFPLFTDLIP